jgi:hypothetical protein
VRTNFDGWRTSGVDVMTTAATHETETVLEVGAEGGSLSILRRRLPDGSWTYQAHKNEAALVDLLGDDAEGFAAEADIGATATSFESALRALERYPWPKLTLFTFIPTWRKKFWRHSACT